MSVLLCDNITKIYPNNSSIQNFSFNFLNNKIYAVLGKSDSGKDILLDLITSKTRPTTGTIWVDGEKLTESSVMNDRVCYIRKETTFPKLMMIKTILRKMKNQYPKWDNYYAYLLCNHFNIELNSTFHRLSINKKQIFLGICALASLANITLYDNPVCDADIKDRYDFYNFMYEHHQKYPRTIIITSDHIDEINYLFDKVLFLDKGRLIDYFTCEELSSNFRYLTGKTEVLKSLISGVKIIGAEERNGMLTVCVRKKLTKDERRKYQKYMITISEVPIQKIFIYLINLRELRVKKYDII